MTKADLVKELMCYPHDTEIRIAEWEDNDVASEFPSGSSQIIRLIYVCDTEKGTSPSPELLLVPAPPKG